MDAGITILKLGGSLLTDKSAPRGVLKTQVVERIAKEIHKANTRNLILIHGAGSFGHPLAKEHNLTQGINNNQPGFCHTNNSMLSMTSQLCEILTKEGINAYSMQTSILYTKSKIDTTNILKALEHDLTPVLYGTVTLHATKHGAILSGDTIILDLVSQLKDKITQVLFASDVDGILDEQGNTLKKISTEQDFITGSQTTDVTGGMQGKIQAMLESVIPARVFNGAIEGNITKALQGKEVGTYISRE